jgi:hypothetical protein
MSASGFTAEQIVKELAKLGNAGYKRTMLNHRATEPYFGVKISELKKYRFSAKVADDGLRATMGGGKEVVHFRPSDGAVRCGCQSWRTLSWKRQEVSMP